MSDMGQGGAAAGPMETKAHGGAESVAAFGEFMAAFESFREANDDRLGQIEKRMSVDVLSEEKVDRINRALDEQERRMERLTLKEMRPPLGGAGGGERRGAMPSEHKTAFERYVRGGDEQGLRRLEEKAMSGLVGADGGFLVPDETANEIGRRLIAISPIRSISAVRTVSAAVLKKPFAITGAQTGWVGQSSVRPQTDAPQLAELSFPTMELYAMPAATNALLDDAAVDIDSWIGQEVEQAFASQEGAAFVNGDGISKPKGFTTYPTVTEANWTWGSVGTVATGADAGFLPGTAADAL